MRLRSGLKTRKNEKDGCLARELRCAEEVDGTRDSLKSRCLSDFYATIDYVALCRENGDGDPRCVQTTRDRKTGKFKSSKCKSQVGTSKNWTSLAYLARGGFVILGLIRDQILSPKASREWV